MGTMQSRNHHHPVRPKQKMLSPLLYDLSAALNTLPLVRVVPEQFYPPPTPPHTERGEVRLMRAVLADALLCFQKYALSPRRARQRLHEEAKEWIFANEHHWPFSFVNVCAVLGLDPDYIRLLLKRWQQKAQAGMPPPLLRPSKLLAA